MCCRISCVFLLGGFCVKVSRRIAQFLIFLLKYEEEVKVDKSFRWYGHEICELRKFFYQRICGLVPTEYGRFIASNVSRSSFNRTIRIMLKQGLISLSFQSKTRFQDIDLSNIRLTEKGKKVAIALKKEALEYIEDFSFLLDKSK